MRRSVLIAAMFVLLPAVMFAQEATKTEPHTGTLTVLVTGLKNDKGEVRLALTNSEENYSSKDAKPYRGIKVPIKDKKAEGVFEKLPFGEYAIRLFHDKNSNGKLDTTLGIPNEDYAFSNNARGTFGPPKYEKAKFEFNKEQMTIEIKIRVNE
jgi:uncharacterized protein (DUF2141 family)